MFMQKNEIAEFNECQEHTGNHNENTDACPELLKHKSQAKI